LPAALLPGSFRNKDFAAFRARREVLFFFRRQLFVFVDCHCLALGSQFPIRLIKRNGAFDVSARIQNANLTRPEARSGFGIVDGLTFLWEYRLNSWRFKNFPAPTVRFDFNDCH
jgi:hypothetical protein